MYRAGKRPQSKKRKLFKIIILLILLASLALLGYVAVKKWYKPTTAIKQAAAKITKVSYDGQKRTFTEPDFALDLPIDWTAEPTPPHTYNSFTWQSADRGSDGQIITVYEDTIPVNFAVNKVLVVEGQTYQIGLDGTVSDNCVNFTKDTSSSGRVGATAKWLNVDFLCDQNNTERDVVGTSSTDGVNTVILRSPRTGQNHKFFFTYTDFSINSDYSVFYYALQSFRMQ